jgi:glycerol-3-phosphate acyltransferase PlsY
MSGGRDRRRFGALKTIAFVGAGFAAGSLPTGKLVTRLLTGESLEDLGDGKVGSSNVARSVGWKAGAVVLALDTLKAYAPAVAARLAGAGDNTVALVGISAMDGHIVFVKGRGAASALGAAFAMDPAMMAVACVPLVGGSLLHRHAQAVTATALSLPFISLALHRSPRRVLGPLALISLLFAARLRGATGSPLPRSPQVYWNRFLLDRDER